MRISVRSNIKEVSKGLSALEKKYVPNATRNAINETLFGLRKALPDEMRSVFDEPVSFTTRPSAWQVDKSGKHELQGEIKLKRQQASYLKYQVYGGRRTPIRKAIPVPRKSQMARHGGLKKNWKALLDKPNYFTGSLKGRTDSTPGIYRRLGVSAKNPGGKRLRLEISWEKKTDYQKRFHFHEYSERYVKRHFRSHFRKKLAWYVKNRG